MAVVPWSPAAGGVALTVRLTPKAGRDLIDGIEIMSDGRSVLKIRVQAIPSEGEANAALIALIAKQIGVPRSQLAIAGGATARLKTVAVQGDAAALAARLRAHFTAA